MAIYVLIDDVDFDAGEMYAHVRFPDGSGRPVRVAPSLRNGLAEEFRARRSGDQGPEYVLVATPAGLRVLDRGRRRPEVYFWLRRADNGMQSCRAVLSTTDVGNCADSRGE